MHPRVLLLILTWWQLLKERTVRALDCQSSSESFTSVFHLGRGGGVPKGQLGSSSVHSCPRIASVYAEVIDVRGPVSYVLPISYGLDSVRELAVVGGMLSWQKALAVVWLLFNEALQFMLLTPLLRAPLWCNLLLHPCPVLLPFSPVSRVMRVALLRTTFSHVGFLMVVFSKNMYSGVVSGVVKGLSESSCSQYELCRKEFRSFLWVYRVTGMSQDVFRFLCFLSWKKHRTTVTIAMKYSI